MKKKTISIFCLVLTLLFIIPGIDASALWLSPLAEFGDVNNDGYLQANDARNILRVSAGIAQFNPPRRWTSKNVFGDLDGDGKVTATDARICLRRSAGLDPIDGTPSVVPQTNESDLFISRKFYAECSAVKDGKTYNFAYATNGTDTYLFSDSEEMPFELLRKGSVNYFMNPDTKKYCQISSSLFVAFGIDASQLSITMLKPKSAKPTTTENVVKDGKTYTCLTYKMTDNTSEKHYVLNGSLKFVEYCNVYGTLTSTMTVKSISADTTKILAIPENYKLENPLTFFESIID